MKRWLETIIRRFAPKPRLKKTDFHWGDEAGLGSDHQSGTTWGLKGQTPVVVGTGYRFCIKMITKMNNRGLTRFIIFSGRFTSDVVIKFLDRLLKSTAGKLFLIVDNLSVHKLKAVKAWIGEPEQAKWLRLN